MYVSSNTKRYLNKQSFLGLIQKYRSVEISQINNSQYRSALQYTRSAPANKKSIQKHEFSQLNLIYIFERLGWLYVSYRVVQQPFVFFMMYYYAKLTRYSKQGLTPELPLNSFHNYRDNNWIIFSKPAQQLFLVIFKSKPIFVFTGGLMRIVMNEKKKASRKNAKVAISLVRLATILVKKKNYFEFGAIKMSNIGRIRYQVLKIFRKTQVARKIYYVISIIKVDISAQKWSTRRAIKKYLKKRVTT